MVPGFAVGLVPDTPYFAAMADANLHGLKFVDRDSANGALPLYSPLDFALLAHCDGDGFIRVSGLPSLPYILHAKFPFGLQPSTGRMLIAHAQLQPDKTTDIALTNANIVGTSDTVRPGQGIDFKLLGEAFKKLPVAALPEEGAAAERAISALDRGDLNTAMNATIEYVDICVKVQRCSDALALQLHSGFKENRTFFEICAILITAGTATEEEVAISNIGRESRGAVTAGATPLADGGIPVADGILYNGFNGPGPLGVEVAKTFRGSSYTQQVLQQDTNLYRVWGGEARPIASYWTDIAPAGPLQSTTDSALLPTWNNTAQNISIIRVPAGTTIYRGFSSSQQIPSSGTILGGGSQIYIPNVNPSWLLK